MGLEILITVGSLVAAGGAAWGGTKVALNGTRERVKNIDAKLDAHIIANATKMDAHMAHDAQVQVELVERGARTEAKVDMILQRLP